MLPTRPLGQTGIELPLLGFGASPLGGVFGPVDADEGRRAVELALARGLNYFDTAPFYGLTRSERALGRALRDIPRRDYLLSTKVGRYGQNDFDFSAQRVRSSLRESQERLGVEYFDIVFCHDIEFGDTEQIIAETLPALRAEREAGLLRHTGISGLPLDLLRTVAERGRPEVVLSYCRYTLFNTELAAAMDSFREFGAGVVNAAPLGMGLLTRGGPPDWHPAGAELRAACRQAQELCERAGVELASLALDFALAGPAATTLIGMGDSRQVARNLVRIGAKKHPELLDAIRAVFDKLPAAARRWGQK